MKRPVSGIFSGSGVMRVRNSLQGVPHYTACAFTIPADNECDNGEGNANTGNLFLPPFGGGDTNNPAIGGLLPRPDDFLFLNATSATTIIGPYDLYIHRPDGSLGVLSETEGNNTLATANTVPAIPACTTVFSEGTSNQRPAISIYASDVISIPAASPGWVVNGGFNFDNINLDVDYYGPITAGPAETFFVGLDGAPDCRGCPHDQNGINTDTSFDFRSAADAVLATSDGTLIGVAQGEFVSITPGQSFYLRLAGKVADAGKGYQLTMCRVGLTAGNTPTPTPLSPTSTPSITPTPSPTPSSPDTCGVAIPLTLGAAMLGNLAGAADDYEIAALSTCFTNNGAISNPTPSVQTATGRDVVYSFTAPVAGNYTFKAENIYFGTAFSQNLLLHVASNCPVGAPPQLPTCLAAADRNTNAFGLFTASSTSAEEVACLPMTAGQTVFVYVDETSLGTKGGQFFVQVTNCVTESEPNDLPATANAFACDVQGRMLQTLPPLRERPVRGCSSHPIGRHRTVLLDDCRDRWRDDHE